MIDLAPTLARRILVLPPTAMDAAATSEILHRAELPCRVCSSVDELCEEIGRGAGVVVVPEESVIRDHTYAIAGALRGQPRWSNLPVLVLTPSGRQPGDTLRLLLEVGDVTVLKRPLQPAEFLGAVKSALRDRERQYLMRDYLVEQARQSEKLREADRRKDEFLAMLAHELRNPLAPIRNGLQILELAADDPGEIERTREMLDRQVQHLARLVDDLLDVSRITRGKAELRPEPVDLHDIVQRGLETVRPLLDERRHPITISRSGGPMRISGDPTRLTQVVGNLLNNAAKYSEPETPIEIVLETDGDWAVLRIRDHGVGIPREMLPHIFDMFTQVDRTLDRSQGGLGIGLTLVRTLVEMHGGTVVAKSEGVGKGSEFRVRLPLMAVELPHAERTGPRRASGPAMRVLVVDDNADAGNSLAVLLRLAGHEVAVAPDGARALSIANEFQPQAALVDIGLPGMDGFELARRLRDESYGSSLLLIALTGYGQDEDRRRARDAGFDHHLTKPADPEGLAALLAEGARARGNGASKPGPKPSA